MNQATVVQNNQSHPLAQLKGAARSVSTGAENVLLGLKTKAVTAFAVVATAAGMMPVLAEEVVLRDTIKDSPATTQDGTWVKGNQTPANQTPTVATFALHLPANSVCTLSNFSFVFGTITALTTSSSYEWEHIFQLRDGKPCTDLRVEVFSGPTDNLKGNLVGDLYSRSISKVEMQATTVPWGGTENVYAAGSIIDSPYYKATINFPNFEAITTGPEVTTIYLKICFVRLQSGNTLGVIAKTKELPPNGDLGVVNTTQIVPLDKALAGKVVADVVDASQQTETPRCELTTIDDKMAISWPASFGSRFAVLSSTNLYTWEAAPTVGDIVLRDGKCYSILSESRPTSAFFRLSSR